MACKWDIMKNGRQSDFSLADCLGKCYCDRCTREEKKDKEIKRLKKKCGEK